MHSRNMKTLKQRIVLPWENRPTKPNTKHYTLYFRVRRYITKYKTGEKWTRAVTRKWNSLISGNIKSVTNERTETLIKGHLLRADQLACIFNFSKIFSSNLSKFFIFSFLTTWWRIHCSCFLFFGGVNKSEQEEEKPENDAVISSAIIKILYSSSFYISGCIFFSFSFLFYIFILEIFLRDIIT